MRVAFNHIAYAALEVCNPVGLDHVDRALAALAPRSAARALDIGCGNGAVAAHLARAHGLHVTAVERDPVMADLARARIGDAPVDLVQADAAQVLDRNLFDLIVVMGATDAVGKGQRDPAAVFARLHDRLAPGGGLVWGEPFWAAEPSAPFRLIIELTNHYETRQGWEAAAEGAGFQTARFEASSRGDWETYAGAMDRSVRDWVAAHPDAPEARGLIARADAMQSLFEEEGRDVLGFGLWSFRRE